MVLAEKVKIRQLIVYCVIPSTSECGSTKLASVAPEGTYKAAFLNLLFFDHIIQKLKHRVPLFN